MNTTINTPDISQLIHTNTEQPATDQDTIRREQLLAAQARCLMELKTQLKTLTAEKEDLEQAIIAANGVDSTVTADGWRVSVKPGRKTLNQRSFSQAYPPVSHPSLYQEPKPMSLTQLERELGCAQVEAYVSVGKPIVSVTHE